MFLRIGLLFMALLSVSWSLTPVERYGYLQVNGNKIHDQNDKPVQLRGMSFFWSQWQGKFWNSNVVTTFVDDWKATVVRAAMGVESGGYLTDSTKQEKLVDTLVTAAIKKGVYVIIDWHAHDANLTTDRAKRFFGRMAERYKNNPNVIYEIWNEPKQQSWSTIKAYAEAVIPEIRKHDSLNLILVGTPRWSQDVDAVVASPLSDHNVAYVLHFYAGSHGATLRAKGDTALAHGLPLFVSEWGASVANGGTLSSGGSDNKVYLNATELWMTWMDKHKLSWCNWSVSDKDESSAALMGGADWYGDWSIWDLNLSGHYVRNKLRYYYVMDSLTGDTLYNKRFFKNIKDTIQFEHFDEAKGIVAVQQNNTGLNYLVNNIDTNDYLKIPIRTDSAAIYLVTLPYSSMLGGSLELYVNDELVDTLVLDSTGNNYTTKTFELTLPKGDVSLMVKGIANSKGVKTNIATLDLMLIKDESTPILHTFSHQNSLALTMSESGITVQLFKGHKFNQAIMVGAKGQVLQQKSINLNDALLRFNKTNNAAWIRLQGQGISQVIPLQ